MHLFQHDKYLYFERLYKQYYSNKNVDKASKFLIKDEVIFMYEAHFPSMLLILLYDILNLKSNMEFAIRNIHK